MPAAFKILVVDDNPTILKLLCQSLEKCGEVTTATDGADALQKAAKIQPDLIISDYSMPRMNGLELLENLRAEGRDLANSLCFSGVAKGNRRAPSYRSGRR